MATHQFSVFGGSIGEVPLWRAADTRTRAVAHALVDGTCKGGSDRQLFGLLAFDWPQAAAQEREQRGRVPGLKALSLAQLEDLVNGRVDFGCAWALAEVCRAVPRPEVARGLQRAYGDAADGIVSQLRDLRRALAGMDAGPARRFVAFAAGVPLRHWSGSPPTRSLEAALLVSITEAFPQAEELVDRLGRANAAWAGLAKNWEAVKAGVQAGDLESIQRALRSSVKRSASLA